MAQFCRLAEKSNLSWNYLKMILSANVKDGEILKVVLKNRKGRVLFCSVWGAGVLNKALVKDKPKHSDNKIQNKS